MLTDATIKLTVHGKPQPRGSKVAITLYDQVLDSNGRVLRHPDGKPIMTPRLGKNGRPMQYAKDDNPRSKPWMTKIARVAIQTHGKLLLQGPLALTLRFYVARPQYHFGTGRNAGVIKERYIDALPTSKPDRLKLARAVEDALSGVLYVDDAQTVAGPVEKHYCAPHTEPRVEIEITPIVSDPQPTEGRE